jgi:hypothetical protein
MPAHTARWNASGMQTRQVFWNASLAAGAPSLRYAVSADGIRHEAHQYQPTVTTNLDSVFDMIDTLASGAQNIVDMLCERILPKASASAEKSRKLATDP